MWLGLHWTTRAPQFLIHCTQIMYSITTQACVLMCSATCATCATYKSSSRKFFMTAYSKQLVLLTGQLILYHHVDVIHSVTKYHKFKLLAALFMVVLRAIATCI